MKIAAFNAKKLGWRKVNNVFVQKYLIEIVSRYSVVVMLEVMDQSGEAMDKFLSKLNSYGRNKNHPYAMKCSESLGRSSHKEKFVYFYRKDEVTMIDSYQYEEEEEEEKEEGNDDDEEDEYENGYEGQEDEYEDDEYDEEEEQQEEEQEEEGEEEEYDENDDDEEDEYEGEQEEYEYGYEYGEYDEEEEEGNDDDEEDEYEGEQEEYEGQEDEYDEEEQQQQEEDDDDDEEDEYEGEQEEYEFGYEYGEYDEEEEEDEEDDEADNVEGMLEREPFILLLKCPNTVVQKLVLIPVHTKPADAEIELEALADVVEDAKKRWRTDKIMILGDFNADGRYLSKKRKDKISISSAHYHWLIDDDVTTTTSNCNDHTYDRIVVYKRTTLNAIVPGSAKPFNFQEAYKLTDEETQRISDHYPVEVELKTNKKAASQRKMSPP